MYTMHMTNGELLKGWKYMANVERFRIRSEHTIVLNMQTLYHDLKLSKSESIFKLGIKPQQNISSRVELVKENRLQ